MTTKKQRKKRMTKRFPAQVQFLASYGPPGGEALTPRQAETLLAIASHWQAFGRAPSCSEIAEALAVKRSGAQRLMDECRSKGFATGPVMTGDWRLSEKGAAALREWAEKKEPLA